MLSPKPPADPAPTNPNDLVEAIKNRSAPSGQSTRRVNFLISELQEVRNGARPISVDDLYNIARTKSARRAELTRQNTNEQVAQALKDALNAKNEVERIQFLTRLSGVAVPTASCVLAWSYPDNWGVIDRRAWNTLRKARVVSGCPGGINLGPSQWQEYCKKIAWLEKETGKTPRDIDLCLYFIDKESNDRFAPTPRRCKKSCMREYPTS